MNANYDNYNNAVGPQVRAPKAKAGRAIPMLAALSLLGGLQCATQFFAHEFQYQAALGTHFQHLYAPWSILTWASKWHRVYRDAIVRAGSVGILPTAVALMALAFAKMLLTNSLRRNPYLHGSARWANLRDIQRSGLLPRPRTFSEVITGRGATPGLVCMSARGSTSAGGGTTCVTADRSMFYAMRQHDPARVWAWWYRRCCPGAGAL